MLASTTFGDLTAVQQVLALSGYVTVALGLAISYIAYQGWRRNDSRPMLLIAVGFILVIGIPGVLQTLMLFFDIGGRILMATVMRISQIAGMAAILWALWRD
ncbi:hypothetical protein ACKVMT_15030 [Halobacteriales archaeon Cl-PHB]